MSNEPNPHENIEETVLTEEECARRLSVERETLSRWRDELGMPFVPMGDGSKPRVRYIWSDVVGWMRSRSCGWRPARPERKRGRPRNVDRGGGA